MLKYPLGHHITFQDGGIVCFYRSHLGSLHGHHVCIIGDKKFKSTMVRRPLWHDIPAKFHENLSITIRKKDIWTLLHLQTISSCTFFLIILSGVRLSPLATPATTGLLYQHRMVMVTVEQLVE
jgi:hypothetical protein